MMLKKRKLVNLSFFKTILLMFAICLGAGLLGFFIYNLLSSNLIVALCVSGAVILGTVMLLICTFNVANFKVILFRNKKSR